MQVSISELNGQNLALLLWYLDENQDQRAVLLYGKLELEGSLALLTRGEYFSPLRFSRKLLSKVRRVPDDMRDIFRQCNFCLQLTPGDLPFRKPEENYSAMLRAWA